MVLKIISERHVGCFIMDGPSWELSNNWPVIMSSKGSDQTQGISRNNSLGRTQCCLCSILAQYSCLELIKPLDLSPASRTTGNTGLRATREHHRCTISKLQNRAICSQIPLSQSEVKGKTGGRGICKPKSLKGVLVKCSVWLLFESHFEQMKSN